MLALRQCAGLELSRQRICCAVSLNHRLAGKDLLTYEDLYGENFLMMHRGWSNYVDELRDDIWKNHPQIHVVDLTYTAWRFSTSARTATIVLMAAENWKDVHPLLKLFPVEWKYTIPYGILYSQKPSDLVKAVSESHEKGTPIV